MRSDPGVTSHRENLLRGYHWVRQTLRPCARQWSLCHKPRVRQDLFSLITHTGCVLQTSLHTAVGAASALNASCVAFFDKATGVGCIANDDAQIRTETAQFQKRNERPPSPQPSVVTMTRSVPVL